VATLKVAIQDLQKTNRHLRYQLAPFLPVPAAPLPTQPGHEEARKPKEIIYPPLLKGRDVFYFTGQVRRAAAESAGESLRALGPRDVRKFCVHKGSLGPETFPPRAVVVLDIRFVSHKHSITIEDRARRSGAEYVRVNSGKGGLVRAVVTALDARTRGEISGQEPQREEA
jgi:hypothetical protein